MKKLCLLLLCCLSFSLNAQETATTTETSQEQLRCEVSEKYKSGAKKQERYFNVSDKKVKTVNYFENGDVLSEYAFDSNGDKKSYIRYTKNGTIDQKKYYYPGNKVKSRIVFEDFYNKKNKKEDERPDHAYFFYPNGNKKFETHFQKGKLVYISIFNSKELKIKSLMYNLGVLSGENTWYYGKAHGWDYGIDKNGVKTKGDFEYRGVPAKEEDHPNWQQDIFEFEKIPEYEKEIDMLLKKYKLI